MPDCAHFGLVDCMIKLNKIRLDFSFQCSGGWGFIFICKTLHIS